MPKLSYNTAPIFIFVSLENNHDILNDTQQLNALLICAGYNPKFSGQLNARSEHESEVWLQDTSAYLVERSTDATTVVQVMQFIKRHSVRPGSDFAQRAEVEVRGDRPDEGRSNFCVHGMAVCGYNGHCPSIKEHVRCCYNR